MPESNGLSLDTAVAAVGVLADEMPVTGLGATGITFANGDGPRTIEAIARLAGAAFVSR